MENSTAQPQPQGQGAPGLAIAGFVTGLVGLIFSISFVGFFIGGPLCIVGIVLSGIGLNQANQRNAPRGLAIGGLTCAVVGFIIALVIVVLALASIRAV